MYLSLSKNKIYRQNGRNYIYTSEHLKPHPVGGAPFKYVTGNLVEELNQHSG